jgi:hypothetical protein
MSEDSEFFNKNKPQMNADERKCGVDFCGSLGKGMLAKEKIETFGNSSGLTPLSFGVNFRKNTEMLSNSSGLSPFCPSGEIYSRCSCIGIEKNETAEKELNVSVHSVPLSFRGKFPEVGVI